jgi:lysozyme
MKTPFFLLLVILLLSIVNGLKTRPWKLPLGRKILSTTEQMSATSISNGATLVATTGVNIRSGPCTTYAIVGGLSTGEATTYTGSTSSGCGYIWYSVTNGWVASEFVTAVRTINNAGLNLVKSSEGFRPCKYQDPAGYWTIGYGHLIQPGQSFTCITEQEATRLLLSDLGVAEQCVSSSVHVYLNDNQFSALVDFTFNLGCGAFQGSTLLKDINAGNFGAVCGQLKLWVYGGGRVLPGLVTRRNAECQLFNS